MPGEKEVAQATIRVVERFRQPGEERPMKRTSNIDVVLNVLQAAGRPLHVTEIIGMSRREHDTEQGRDSIVSALLKKVQDGQGVLCLRPVCICQRRQKRTGGVKRQ